MERNKPSQGEQQWVRPERGNKQSIQSQEASHQSSVFSQELENKPFSQRLEQKYSAILQDPDITASLGPYLSLITDGMVATGTLSQEQAQNLVQQSEDSADKLTNADQVMHFQRTEAHVQQNGNQQMNQAGTGNSSW